jgi:hypothetical protein
MHPILLLIIVLAVLLTVSWLKRQPPAQRKKMGFRAAMAAAAGIILVGLLTGKLNPLIALVAAAIPVMQRLMVAKSVLDRIKSMGGPNPGRTSSVSTRYLDMSLDHDSGEMRGRVLDGPFAGRSLDDLTLEELLSLALCRRDDAQSAAVLEAWLDRVHGSDWRERDQFAGGQAHRGRERMSAEEARQVLGIDEGADRNEVIQAHRRLMQKLHPDRGGSAYLAAKLNQAKDVLLDGA